MLVITNNVNAQGIPNDTLLSLNWSPDTAIPAITWSVGVVGHVRSIWLRHVGVGGNANPQELIRGDYVQAIYSFNGHGGVGSWLLVASAAGRATNLWRLDAVQGMLPVMLTSGKQVNFAQWSPDGSQIDYLDSISLGVGAFHVVNVTTQVDTFIASSVTNTPNPAWSSTGQQLVYSTGTQTVVVDLQKGKKLSTLSLHGLASTYIWSATSSNQLVLALGDGQPGIYLVDTQRRTTHQIDSEATDGPIVWTEIP
jgi:Tol biopolymer transport system component